MAFRVRAPVLAGAFRVSFTAEATDSWSECAATELNGVLVSCLVCRAAREGEGRSVRAVGCDVLARVLKIAATPRRV